MRDVRQADHQLGCHPRLLPQSLPRPVRDRGPAAGRPRARAVRPLGAGVEIMRIADCGMARRVLSHESYCPGEPRMRLFLPVALAFLGTPLAAQSLLYRSPNLGGTWTPDPGVVQFNFVHRFYVAPAAGGHKVTNFPTFTVAAGLGQRVALGVHYGSNSLLSLSPYHPHEAEVYARYRFVGGAAGVPGLAVAVTPAYNSAAQSADGELSLDYTREPFTLSGAVRGMSHPLRDPDARAAIAAGAVWRVPDSLPDS